MLLGNGDGTFQAAVVSTSGVVVSSVATGDFNRDGKLDVVVDNECADPGCASGSVNVLLGKGDGTFQPPLTFSAGGNAFSVEAGDLNGDGKLDLVGVNGLGSVGVLLGNGDGTFQPVSTFTTLPGNSAVFLGDFNGDHKLDLAVVNGTCDAIPACTRIAVLRHGTGGGFPWNRLVARLRGVIKLWHRDGKTLQHTSAPFVRANLGLAYSGVSNDGCRIWSAPSLQLMQSGGMLG